MSGEAAAPVSARARLERVRDRGLDVLAGCVGLEAQRAMGAVLRFLNDELAEEAAERRDFADRLLGGREAAEEPLPAPRDDGEPPLPLDLGAGR